MILYHLLTNYSINEINCQYFGRKRPCWDNYGIGLIKKDPPILAGLVEDKKLLIRAGNNFPSQPVLETPFFLFNEGIFD